ncbi:tRNA (guanosine(37)-N1)-methyltransferase TrmD [Anaerosinus sp.]|uniref:tRNA (guanosine(37)-N1)-methyltransferase TrmD n=1 Tax=Selenobaculum sp. TaxID=3074374 RepID=UPI0015AA530B
MKIDIVTLFPEMFAGTFGQSMIKRAVKENILTIHTINPRDFAEDKHNTVDDYPFGGGAGMVLKPEPVYRAIDSIPTFSENKRVILLCPSGATFSQKKAIELSKYDQLVLICGHYEGFDARISYLADEKISIGDYVLTGGEIPAMVLVDTVARMLPGVLGSMESALTDSFYNDLLEHPQYTRPRNFLGMEVPEVLLSGNHAKISDWRRKESLRITLLNRPDLLDKTSLSSKDVLFLEEIKRELGDL